MQTQTQTQTQIEMLNVGNRNLNCLDASHQYLQERVGNYGRSTTETMQNHAATARSARERFRARRSQLRRSMPRSASTPRLGTALRAPGQPEIAAGGHGGLCRPSQVFDVVARGRARTLESLREPNESRTLASVFARARECCGGCGCLRAECKNHWWRFVGRISVQGNPTMALNWIVGIGGPPYLRLVAIHGLLRHSTIGQFAIPDLHTGSVEAKQTAHTVRREKLESEMHIKEVSVEEWLQTWMPGSDLSNEAEATLENLNPKQVDLKGLERNMYPGLCNLFNEIIKSFGPGGFRMWVTVDHVAVDSDGTKLEPDLTLYPDNATEDVAVKTPPQMSDPLALIKAKTNWALAELVVEAKVKPELRPFYSMGSTWFKEDAASHKKARGQVIEYGYELLSYQHRRYTPIICIFQDEARFLAFDRAAGNVSRPFNYVKDLKPLATFFHHYAQAQPVRRGFDYTVSKATKAEHRFFVDLKTKYPPTAHFHALFNKAATPGWPTYKLSLHSSLFAPEATFLFASPEFMSRLITGHATRTFVAWLLASDRQHPVFIKDSWRSLAAAAADNLSEYEKAFDPEVDEPISGRIHMRLVMKEVCRPLISFKDWYELVLVTYNALKAHRAAWEHHGILHRDLSIGNILIFNAYSESTKPTVTRGILSDWDLAKTKQQLQVPKASQPYRSGTWQFLSAALQRNLEKPHLLSDDLESILHIFNWLALQYMESDTYQTTMDVAARIKSIYDAVAENNLAWKRKDSMHPFILLLEKLTELCMIQYSCIDPFSAPEGAGGNISNTHGSTIKAGTPGSPHNAPLNTHDAVFAAFEEVLKVDRESWQSLRKRENPLSQLLPLPSFIPHQ
ncbi:hypothetical protein NUW54_g3261 [Trametes sanguinea]|uniref:Uncharacterized protein n=1 Tax=Trametes sanguinea TaxID=158606 RepID=A0ACC1Q1T6_9APHY|nr:hypothetical protein NUW54_g3261 [Trametes sanguinea]